MRQQWHPGDNKKDFDIMSEEADDNQEIELKKEKRNTHTYAQINRNKERKMKKGENKNVKKVVFGVGNKINGQEFLAT